MNIDRFGSQRSASVKRTLERYVINRDGKGNYQFKNKRLCNIQEPEDSSDATSKKYVDTVASNVESRMQVFTEKTSYQHMNEFEAKLRSHVQISLDSQYESLMKYLSNNMLKRDEQNNILLENSRIKVVLPPMHDVDVPNKKFVTEYINARTPQIDVDGNVSFRNRRIREISEPVSDSDAASKKFVRDYIEKKRTEIQASITSMPKEIVAAVSKNLEPMLNRQQSLDKLLTSAMNDIGTLKTQVRVINNILEQLRGQFIVSLQTKPLKGTSLRYTLASGLEYYSVPVTGDLMNCSISSSRTSAAFGTLMAINDKLVESYPTSIKKEDRITFKAPPDRARDGHILSIDLRIAYKLLGNF